MKNFTRIVLFFCLVPVLVNAQKVNLQLRLGNGFTFNQHIQTTTKVTQTIRQQPLVIEYTTNSYLRFEVIAVKDTVYELSVKYDSLALLMDLPTGTFRFNAAGADSSYYSKLLAAFAKNKMYISVAKSGRILKVTGCNEAISALPQQVVQPDSLQQKQAITQLQQLFGDEASSTTIQNVLVIYPTTAVAPGGNWSYSAKQASPYPVSSEGILTLAGVTNGTYNIKGSMMVSSDTASTQTLQMNNMPVNYRFSGSLNTSNSTSKVTGLIVKSTQEMDIKGIATIPDNPSLPGGILIPVAVNIKTVVATY